MVGLGPVKAAAARDQDLLLVQQVEGELLVVGDVELLHIHLGEDVERRARLDHRDAVDLAECLVHIIALLVDTAAGANVVVDRLMAAERRLDDGLSRHVRAQAHVREHIDAHNKIAHAALVARKHHPANTVARDHVRLGQAAKSDAGQVGSERSDRDVLVTVHAQTVVNLVRKNHQLVPARNLDDALEHLARIDGTRGVVGVNDDEGLGRARDLGLHVLQVGIPIRLLIAQIMHGMTAGKGCARRPQRIVGAGDQDLVAVVEQRVHRKLNEFGHAIARIDMLHLNIGQALDLRILHDRLACGEQAARIGIPLAVGQLLAHVLDDLIGRAETEGSGVADIELEDALALVLHTGRLVDDGAAHVIQDVIELGGFRESTHGGAPCNLSRGARFGFGNVTGRGRLALVGVAGEQPGNIDLQNTGEQLCHIAPRDRLAAHILAHLTLAEFFAEHLRCTNHVRLSNVAIGHGLSQAIAKRLLGH